MGVFVVLGESSWDTGAPISHPMASHLKMIYLLHLRALDSYLWNCSVVVSCIICTSAHQCNNTHRYGTQALFLSALPASESEVGTWWLRELAPYPYIAEHPKTFMWFDPFKFSFLLLVIFCFCYSLCCEEL